MFYVKEKFNETVEIAVVIHEHNVFCTCPGCGVDVCVDLTELFNDGKSDLYSTAVYCPECSRSRLEGSDEQI